MSNLQRRERRKAAINSGRTFASYPDAQNKKDVDRNKRGVKTVKPDGTKA